MFNGEGRTNRVRLRFPRRMKVVELLAQALCEKMKFYEIYEHFRKGSKNGNYV